MMLGVCGPALVRPLVVLATLSASGCWAPPRADVQPRGEPGLIEAGIRVESVVDPAIVQSVDVPSRTLVLVSNLRRSGQPYRVDPKVSGLSRLRAGDGVRATVIDDLSVYVLPADNGSGPHSDSLRPDARVLSVDRSYRLLTVQYPDGHDETFKVRREVELRKMQPGDAVLMRPVELIALSRQK